MQIVVQSEKKYVDGVFVRGLLRLNFLHPDWFLTPTVFVVANAFDVADNVFAKPFDLAALPVDDRVRKSWSLGLLYR